MSDAFDVFHLDGMSAIVTGGMGLLGKEFSKTLAGAGAGVIIADINQTGSEELITSFRECGFNAHFILVDVTDPASTIEMVQFAEERFGRIDILVNSAAMDPKFDPDHLDENSNPFEDYPLNSWKQALDVNLTGMFLVTQAVARSMVKQATGSIINICSTYGLVGPDQSIYQNPSKPKRFKPAYYSTTKSGVLGFTRYLAAYYAGTQIRVNALTPGGIFNDHDEDFVRAYSARAILGRMARKDEMNGALLFLASEASSYMTGANLVVDGGWTAW